MKRNLLLILFLMSGSLVFAAQPAMQKVYADKSKSTITYSMNHLLHSWDGTSNDVNSIIVTDEDRSVISQVAVTVKVSSFDSKNANRDSHTMEATDAIKFPSISFTSNSITQDGNMLHATGILNFHGVSKTITIDAEKRIVKDKAEITGTFDVKMTDYGIDPPSLMGVATDDDIKLTFDMFY